MTAVKTAEVVAEVGVAHPVPNHEGMTAAHPCVAEGTGMVPGMPPVGMTVGDPAMLVVKTIGVQDPEHFQLVKNGGMTAGMTVGLDSLLRRTHPQSVPPLSLQNKMVEKMMVGHRSKNNMYPYHPYTVQSK